MDNEKKLFPLGHLDGGSNYIFNHVFKPKVHDSSPPTPEQEHDSEIIIVNECGDVIIQPEYLSEMPWYEDFEQWANKQTEHLR